MKGLTLIFISTVFTVLLFGCAPAKANHSSENTLFPESAISDCNQSVMVELLVAIKSDSGWMVWSTWRGVGPYSVTTVEKNFSKIHEDYQSVANKEIPHEPGTSFALCQDNCPSDAFYDSSTVLAELPENCPETGDPDFSTAKPGDSFSTADKRMYLVPVKGTQAVRTDGSLVTYADGTQEKLEVLLKDLHLTDHLNWTLP